MIEGMPMFEHFSENEKREFAQTQYSMLKFKNGDDVIAEGELSKSLYLLVKGTCLVTRTADNTKIRLSKLSPGEIFGEMSFFSDKPRQSTVTATDDVLILKMDDNFFEKINPSIRAKIKEYLIELLVSRLDNMNAAIMKISKLMRS